MWPPRRTRSASIIAHVHFEASWGEVSKEASAEADMFGKSRKSSSLLMLQMKTVLSSGGGAGLRIAVFVSLCVCQSVCLSVCVSVGLSVCVSISPSVRLSVCLSICPSVCLSVCLSVRPSVCLVEQSPC